ncbi:uncharacterized protein [Amphiura filiformis]|uniref:uncharacterized protein n=1 Tax=Amphiura filiformis TaxID=82378 RepID=UPI003B20B7FC
MTENQQHQTIYSAIEGKPYQKHVLRQFHMVENSLKNKTDPKLVDLRRHIAEVALKEPYMGEKIPLRWLQFEKAIIEAVSNNTTHMHIQKVRDLAKSFKIKDNREFSTMLQFFHDLGCIVYFGRDKRGKHNQALRDIVVLDPQWLIDVFKRIITVKPDCRQWSTFCNLWQRLRDDGILEEELIDHVWEDFKGLKPTFISLMEMFDLLCPQYIPTKDDKKTKETKFYYVPACLQPGKETKPRSGVDGDEDSIFYVDFEEFLPDGLFHRVLVHFARWSQEDGHHPPKLHYRHGTFYVGAQKNRHIIELCMRPSNPACIKVMVRRPTVVSKLRKREAHRQACPGMCSQVQRKLDNILDIVKQTWIHGIQYSFKVLCEGCCNPDQGMPSEDSSRLHLLCFHECTHADIDSIFCSRSESNVETEIYRKRFKISDCQTKETKNDQSKDGNGNISYS